MRKDTQREGQTLRVCQTRQTLGVRHHQARKGQELPAATRIHARETWDISPAELLEGSNLPDTEVWASGLVNCETATCTYFKTPDVWYCYSRPGTHARAHPCPPQAGMNVTPSQARHPRDRWSHHPTRTRDSGNFKQMLLLISESPRATAHALSPWAGLVARPFSFQWHHSAALK